METKIIETPVERRKVELKCWLTGRDRRAIDSVFYADIDIGVKNKEPEISGMKGNLINKAQDKVIETMIISIDDNKEDILNRFLEMRDDDCDFIFKEIEAITKKKQS